jgi:hypothetical protein
LTRVTSGRTIARKEVAIMSLQPIGAPTYRIVRHAGAAPGWVVQFQDTDDTDWVSFWDGSHWTKVARQHRDGSIEDEVSLQGDGDDAMVLRALELLEERKEVRATAHRAAPASLALGVGAAVGAVLALVAGAPGWLVVVLAAVGLLGFGLALRWVVQGRGQAAIRSDEANAHAEARKVEITGDLSENAMLGSEVAVAIGASAGGVLAIAVLLLAVLELL